jgi:hypothetical protein
MSPMAQLYLRNAKKVECASAFPPTAISVTVKISKIVPKDSAVLIYTPPLQIDPFDSTDLKPWRMFLLKGMKCIIKLFSAAVISNWIF